MIAYLRNEIVLVWAALVALTALSWWLGADHGVTSVAVATTVVLVVAFVKVTLIGRTFMELKHAAPVLKALFFGLTTVICATLVWIYLTS
ncbi:MAG TPA: cytochrome C oxidase subunit IV family protein [Pseudonocardia sp.]|nr:cytochrome C oxidase subunit IV family protein [Pseudonocardia sp.]